jgi:hypothetical protein
MECLLSMPLEWTKSSELWHSRQLWRLNVSLEETITLRWMKWLPCWMAVMVHLTVSSIMCCSSIKCLQGWCLDERLLNWRKDVWMPARNFCDDTKQDEVHSDWRWKLGPLQPAWNEEGKQRWCHFSSPKTKISAHHKPKFQLADVCGKSDDDTILGSPRSTCGA